MDACMQYLESANECILQMHDIPLFDSLFLMESADVEEKQKQNEESVKKSMSFFKKAVGAIKAIIEKMQEILRNFLDYIGLSKSDKSAFKKFEEECRRNPEFANKKITVKNWREIDKAYKDVIVEAEKEIKRLEQEKEESRPNIFNALKDKFSKSKKVVKDIGVEMTIAQAINLAKGDREFAANLNKKITSLRKYTTILDDNIDEKRLDATQKQLKKLSSKHALVRFLAGAQKQSEEEQITSVRDTFSQMSTWYKAVKNVSKGSPEGEQLVKNAKGFMKDVGKQSIEENLSQRKTRRQLKKQKKKLEKKRKKDE